MCPSTLPFMCAVRSRLRFVVSRAPRVCLVYVVPEVLISMSCPSLPRPVMACPVMLSYKYDVNSCPVVSCMACHIMLYHGLSCHVVSCPLVPCPVI